MNMKLRKLLPLFVLGAALVPTFLFAQEAVEPAAEAATEAVSEDSFLDTLAQGGWVMWPLLFCSIALVWLTVDGYMRSMIKRMFPPAHIEQIRTLFQNTFCLFAKRIRPRFPTSFAWASSSFPTEKR